MSSRSAEPAAGADGRSASRTSLSITARLTLLFAGSTIAILILAGVFLYLAVAEGLYRDDVEALSDQMGSIVSVLQQDPNLSASPGTLLRRQYADFTDSDFTLRIRDGSGRDVFQTPRPAPTVPRDLFPDPVAGPSPGALEVRPRRRDGRSYLIATEVVPVGASGRRRIVQLAYDASDEVGLTRRYRNEALASILLASLLTTVVAVFIVRRGLRPLQEIRLAAERITAAHLGERVAGRPWPAELADLASAFDRMLERIEDSVTRLSRFSADLAHELRTPLGVLVGEAEVALSKERSPHEYREVIESSLEEYARLSSLIEELLFLAWTENPTSEVRREALETRELADEVVSFYEPLAEERGVALRCEGAAPAVASASLLRRALMNLVSNALKFTPRGGEVLVRLEPMRGGARIRVVDTGEGIPEEHRARVFDRFYRVDSARSRDPGGVGLGLAVVRSIAQIHGGEVWAEAAEGGGAQITLTLPQPGPQPSGRAAPARSLSPAGGPS